MKIKGGDLKFKLAGMGLLIAPILGGLVQKHEVLSHEEIIGALFACCLMFIANLTPKFIRILLRNHSKFKTHYVVSQLIVLVFSIIIPIQYIFIVVMPLYIYIGDLAIKSLEEL